MAKNRGLGGGAPSCSFLVLHFVGSHSGTRSLSSSSVCISRQFGIIVGFGSSVGSIFIIICVAGYLSLSLVDIFICMVNHVTISIRDYQMRWKNEMSALSVCGERCMSDYLCRFCIQVALQVRHI